jgi:hypothetical protein
MTLTDDAHERRWRRIRRWKEKQKKEEHLSYDAIPITTFASVFAVIIAFFRLIDMTFHSTVLYAASNKISHKYRCARSLSFEDPS